MSIKQYNAVVRQIAEKWASHHGIDTPAYRRSMAAFIRQIRETYPRRP